MDTSLTLSFESDFRETHFNGLVIFHSHNFKGESKMGRREIGYSSLNLGMARAQRRTMGVWTVS